MREIPEVDDVQMAFGGGAMRMLPPMADIPAEFKPHGWSSRGGEVRYFGPPGVGINAKWLKVVTDWFYHGLEGAEWTPRPGVDARKALRVVAACMGSFEPQHEHKEAGCAYLLSEWFEDVTYTPGKGPA